MENLTAAHSSLSPRSGATPPRIKHLRAFDLEALRRLRDHGPLTIPQAYDCGHSLNETKGHGMNRLVAAAFVVFHDWDVARDDALWVITNKGKNVLRRIEAHQS